MAEHSPNTLAREEKATTTASAYRLIRRTRHTVRHPQRSRMKRKKKEKKTSLPTAGIASGRFLWIECNTV